MFLHYLPDINVGWIVLHKNGCSSTIAAIRNAGYSLVTEMPPEEFAQLPVRVAHWRCPRARLESAYRMYQHMACPHALGSFSDFVLDVCADHKGDVHVMPQVERCMWRDQWLPTKLIRWDFAALALALKTGPIPHERRGDAVPTIWTPAAELVFADRYAADIALWAGV
jgi:hypothetical protein